MGRAQMRNMGKTYEPWKISMPAGTYNKQVFIDPFVGRSSPVPGHSVEKPVAKRTPDFMWPFSSAKKPAELMGIPVSKITGKVNEPVELEFLIPVSKVNQELESQILRENMKPKFNV